MNRENRKDILEVVGLVAIIASLIFVALEVREVNLATRIAARDAITQGHLEFMGARLPKGAVLELATVKFIEAREDALFIGRPGLGKIHCAKAIAQLAVQRGYRVL